MSKWTDWPAYTVEANGLNIHYYRIKGDKPPLVLLHGLTDSGLCWTRTAETLAESFDVIMPDARGHGQSDKPETGYSLNDHALDLGTFLEALALKAPPVMGHSMGAATAAVVAAGNPKLIGKLILEDPPWLEVDLNAAERQKRQASNRKGLIHQALLSPYQLSKQAQKNHPNWHPSEFNPWVMAKYDVAPAVSEFIGSSRHWQDTVPKIECPTLLLTGDPSAGAIITPHVAEEIGEMNDKIQVKHFAGAGHNIRREAFDGVMETIVDFLTD